MDNELRIYILVRSDIDIPSGKLVVQVAHAAIGVYQACFELNPGLLGRYNATELVKKICLNAKNVTTLTRARQECQENGIPTFLVQDAGLTVFDEPTITALGIGPVTKDDLPRYVRKLQLY